MSRHLLATLLILAAASTPLAAQQAAGSSLPGHGPIYFTPFIGATAPMGDAKDDLNTGYNLGLAVDWRPETTAAFGLRAEGSYASLGAKGLSGTGVSAKATDMGVNLNGVVWMGPANAVAPYVTGGGSFSHLGVSASGQGQTFSDSENHYGFNIGGGVDVPVGGMSLRLDLRFKSISTNGDSFQSIPITFGLRF